MTVGIAYVDARIRNAIISLWLRRSNQTHVKIFGVTEPQLIFSSRRGKTCLLTPVADDR